MVTWLLRLAGLAGLATNLLAFVANTLALVRFRRSHPADPSRLFSHPLLVRPDDREPGLTIDREGHAVRRHHPHRMGVADAEDQRLAVHRRSIADALNLEVLAESLGDPDHHVVEQRPSQT